MSNEEEKMGLSPRQVAALFQVSERHIQNLCRDGKIPAFKVGKVWRVDRDRLQLWVDNQTQKSDTRLPE